MSDHATKIFEPRSFGDFSLILDQFDSRSERLGRAGHGCDASRSTSLQTARLQVAKRIYGTRRSREQFLQTDLFSEPAWDILLFLYIADAEQRRVNVGAVCAAAGVPASTALRWLQRLATAGMVLKASHPTDQRVHWLVLTPDTKCQLERFFDHVKSRHGFATTESSA